jgi:hypothetical protein
VYNIEEVIIGGLIYLLFVFVLTQSAKKYNVKSISIFFLSLIFTPLIGLIALLASGKKGLVTIERYVCKRCGYEYTDFYEYCPHCAKEGKKIPLQKVKFKSL